LSADEKNILLFLKIIIQTEVDRMKKYALTAALIVASRKDLSIAPFYRT
jgi:hypothetical protein